jgi:type II secretory pathway pseudopilin PulG
MIAVMIILGILAAAIVPRITGSAARQAEVDARNVQRMLSIAAERSSLWTQPVAIDFQADRFDLLSPRTSSESATQTPGAVRWGPDRLVEPVTLTRAKVRRAAVDGQPLKPDAWRITFSPAQPRPVVELEIGIPNQPDAWTIALTPEATSATRTALGAAKSQASATVVDLDDAGKGTARW